MGGERETSELVLAPYLRDDDLTLYNGDVRDVLAGLPDESVDCVVTSPPYWGLRDYGTASWEGGDAGCEHIVGGQVEDGKAPGAIVAGVRPGTDASSCRRCGARRVDQQIGLEQTPGEYIDALVEVFRRVWRVLTPSGSVWLNLGDSFNNYNGNRSSHGRLSGAHRGHPDKPPGYGRDVENLKAKDLVGIPWRVAFALQADGWWLRADVIWSKPNPMPESISDRPTKAHEYVFHLTKSGDTTFWTHRDGRGSATLPPPDHRWIHRETLEERDDEPVDAPHDWRRVNLWAGHDYYFGQEDVREPHAGRASGNVERFVPPIGHAIPNDHRGRSVPWSPLSESDPDVLTLGDLPPEAPAGPDGRRVTRVAAGEGSSQHRDGERWPARGRNVRDVWEIATQAYPDAHFAVMPTKLAALSIKAGCPAQVCVTCGAPRRWVAVRRSTWAERAKAGATRGNLPYGAGTQRAVHGEGVSNDVTPGPVESLELSDCGHDDYRPGVVLDPFAGAGTVAVAARGLGRHALAIELNEEYCELIARRTQQQSLLAEEAP